VVARSALPIIALAAALLPATGCGDARLSLPVSPSPPAAPAGPAAASAGDVASSHATGRVEIRGPAAGVTGACPAIRFTVYGTLVVTDLHTRFDHGVCAMVQNGSWVEVKGYGQPDGSVRAEKIDFDDDSFELKVEGPVSGLTGACPAIRFTVYGTSVVAGPSTRFDDGVCATVRNGSWVEVKGVEQPDGSVLAWRIDLDDDASDARLEGPVAALTGACPAIRFTVYGTPVATDVFTRFDDGVCGTVQNGTWVEVKGIRQPDGSLLAQEIDLDDAAPEITVEGPVGGLAGACPSIRFTVYGTPVGTDVFTRFDDGVCGTVQHGTWVEVKGRTQPDGSLLASKVDIDAPSPEVKLKGRPMSVTGVCPAITFTVNATPVATTGSTRFKDGPCTAVARVSKVEVKGFRQPDGSVLAHSVDLD
jgi:hypothetical protein